MTKKEIISYVFKFWDNRKTLDSTGFYTPVCVNNERIFVKTPWGTIHNSITFCKNTWVYSFAIDQYHYKGLELQNDIFKLTKKDFYNKLRQQQRILEKSFAL